MTSLMPAALALALAAVACAATPATAHELTIVGRITILGRTVDLPPPARDAAPARAPRCQPRPPLLTPMLSAQVGLQAADTGLTHYGLTLPGVVEGNPLMRWATDRPAVMYIVKAAGTAFSVWHLNRTACRNPRIAFWGAAGHQRGADRHRREQLPRRRRGALTRPGIETAGAAGKTAPLALGAGCRPGPTRSMPVPSRRPREHVRPRRFHERRRGVVERPAPGASRCVPGVDRPKPRTRDPRPRDAL